MANGAQARRLGNLAKAKKAQKQTQSFVGVSTRQVRLGYALDMQYAKSVARVGYQHKAAKLINRTDENGNCLAMKACDDNSGLRLRRRSKLSVSGSTVTRLSNPGFVLAEPRDKTVIVERIKTAKRGKGRAKSRKAKPTTVQSGAVLTAHELEFAAKQRRISGHKLETY